MKNTYCPDMQLGEQTLSQFISTSLRQALQMDNELNPELNKKNRTDYIWKKYTVLSFNALKMLLDQKINKINISFSL